MLKSVFLFMDQLCIDDRLIVDRHLINGRSMVIQLINCRLLAAKVHLVPIYYPLVIGLWLLKYLPLWNFKHCLFFNFLTIASSPNGAWEHSLCSKGIILQVALLFSLLENLLTCKVSGELLVTGRNYSFFLVLFFFARFFVNKEALPFVLLEF